MALNRRVCYFTFGRFQPPTTGHADNFAGVKRTAGQNDYRIYISQTVDKKGSNPLHPDRKFYYMNLMFPEHRGKIFSGPKQPVAILQDLMMAGYNEVVFLVGSDRVNAMQFLHKYNGKDFSFRNIEIMSSGSRDADGDTFAISGTKMRRAAFAADFKTFRSGIPRALNDKDCMALMMEIKEALPANFK
ncbi:cytitidyltransferase [Synechococcus phage S-CAM3]|uniref:Cytitidyltransferase n=1 Tax=Synechococcus phage S-CAM3 TaxID=1883366 RepID=A0A1D8KJX5_9CAUD|nr:cytidyltransferase [Synechococcus phage S-CAM3]AOV58683.1 cytitidyltransferase [Synechococcus phage S-CAM3]AOV58923.1 cytitidyltransferase [Synechococcus phage S-CAM3]AOV59162.1 cytitidyltransferase [Synechococcus phage S-CAM3]